MIHYELDTPPDDEPVTLAEAKSYLRVTFNDDDTFIEDILIPAARKSVEKYLNRSLVEQTWKAFLDCFPKNEIRLSKGKVTAITHIKYYLNGVLETLNSSNYIKGAGNGICEIAPSENETWPSTDLRKGAIEIEFVAGYGEPADVPEDIKLGILLTASHFYNNRSLITFGANVMEVPRTGVFLLRPYRIDRL